MPKPRSRVILESLKEYLDQKYIYDHLVIEVDDEWKQWRMTVGTTAAFEIERTRIYFALTVGLNELRTSRIMYVRDLPEPTFPLGSPNLFEDVAKFIKSCFPQRMFTKIF